MLLLQSKSDLTGGPTIGALGVNQFIPDRFIYSGRIGMSYILHLDRIFHRNLDCSFPPLS
jgi:hypothetical protein